MITVITILMMGHKEAGVAGNVASIADQGLIGGHVNATKERETLGIHTMSVIAEIFLTEKITEEKIELADPMLVSTMATIDVSYFLKIVMLIVFSILLFELGIRL